MYELFPLNTSCLIAGPPGVGKFVYCNMLVLNFLARGGRVVFVTTDAHPLEVERLGTLAGVDLRENKRFALVDCYSPRHNLDSNVMDSLRVDNFNQIEAIQLAIDKAVSSVGKPTRIIFYTLSSLLFHNSCKSVLKLVKLLAKKIKSDYGFAAYVFHSGIHHRDAQDIIESLVDGVVEWRFGKDFSRQYRVDHYRGLSVPRKWRDFRDADFDYHREMEEPYLARLVEEKQDSGETSEGNGGFVDD